jgi:hypothetical protein
MEGEMQPVFGSDVSLILIGKAIGTALRLLLTVDQAVATNDDLREAWSMFKDVVMDHSEEKRAVSAKLLCYVSGFIHLNQFLINNVITG